VAEIEDILAMILGDSKFDIESAVLVPFSRGMEKLGLVAIKANMLVIDLVVEVVILTQFFFVSMGTISEISKAQGMVVIVDFFLNEAISLANFEANGRIRLITALIELVGSEYGLEKIDMDMNVTHITIAWDLADSVA
jgi:hypothetical protein